MPQKKVLKLKPKTKIICKILAIIIIALAVFLGYYLHSRNELKKAGYSDVAISNILKKFKKSYALDNPDNKTLNKAFESSAYKEENLEYYKHIKYQNQKNIIQNINKLIRLQRAGAKKAPFYHIVVADSRSPRDGRIVEKIGTYDPMTNPATINLDKEKVATWIKNGAKPTDTVKALIEKAQ